MVKPTNAPIDEYTNATNAEDNTAFYFGELVSEIASDILRTVDVPPGMMPYFCPITNTAWHVAKSNLRCPGCGSKHIDLH